MKLKDVKEQIDNYFDNITAEELYEISVLKYGAFEVTIEIENIHFESTQVSYYPSTNQSVYTNSQLVDNSIVLAA